jgi:hypothetical protein
MRRTLRSVSLLAVLSSVLFGGNCARNEVHSNVTSQSSASNTVTAQSIDEQTAEASREVEAELAKWSPTTADAQVPPEKLRDRSIGIEGEWIGRTGMDSARLNIKRRPDNDYEVEFATSGCLSRWRLTRKGTYRDGTLTLDRPVQEYCPITFKTLYAIRVDGKELLLPAPSVAELLKDLDDSGNSKPHTIGVSFYTYGHRSDRVRDPAAATP